MVQYYNNPFDLRKAMICLKYGYYDHKQQKRIKPDITKSYAESYTLDTLILMPSDCWEHRCATCIESAFIVYDQLMYMINVTNLRSFYYQCNDVDDSNFGIHINVMFKLNDQHYLFDRFCDLRAGFIPIKDELYGLLLTQKAINNNGRVYDYMNPNFDLEEILVKDKPITVRELIDYGHKGGLDN